MTGWRVGVIIAEPELLAVMNRINGSLVYTAPSVSQRAAIQALSMRRSIREKYISEYRDRIFYAADRIEKSPTSASSALRVPSISSPASRKPDWMKSSSARPC